MLGISNKSTGHGVSLSCAIIQAARIAALSIPLAGCVGQHMASRERPLDILGQSDPTTTEPADPFTPPFGMALQGFQFIGSSLHPIFAPLSTPNLFTAAEIAYARTLLEQHGTLDAETLTQLPNESLARLEPVLLSVAISDSSSGISYAARQIIKRIETTQLTDNLCGLLQHCRGRQLERAIELITARPNDKVHTALLRAIYNSGYLESEARDESMALGRALVRLTPSGREHVGELLHHPDERMQMAAAVSLASIQDPTALPVLLRFAASDNAIIAKEAIAHLPEFPECPEILAPLATALAQKELSQDALLALRQVGQDALPILLPYADTAKFINSGIERTGRNRFLQGVAYGEIIEAIQISRAASHYPPPAHPTEPFNALDSILVAGIPKLISDLDRPQLSDDAISGLQALSALVHPYIPTLLPRESARPLLLSYPTALLSSELARYLNTEEISLATLQSCDLLAERIRLLPSHQERQSALVATLDAFPTAPWLRRLAGLCWREEIDAAWVSAALEAAAPTEFTCRVRSEIELAAQHGIMVPLRWSSDNLAEILRNRSASIFDGRPIATLVYARADYNGAFAQHNALVESLIEHDYCVMYFEASTDTEIIRAMHRSTSRTGANRVQPAHLLILGAHSSRTEMTFGRADDPSAKVTCDDLELFRAHHTPDTLRAFTHLILIACQAGEGRDKAENISNMFRALFPHLKEGGIWSSEVSDNVYGIEFDPVSLELSDVLFHYNKIYRP